MKLLLDAHKKNALFHAYLIEGEKKTVLPELFSFFEKTLKIPTNGNPDFYFREFDNFGIDDGRALQVIASRKAITKHKKIFVITFNSINHESQNALLKLFEEPTPNTHFFIMTSFVDDLLPTLRSRLLIIPRQPIEINEVPFAKKFLHSSKQERLRMLSEIIENKDKSAALSFLNSLELTLYSAVGKKGLSKDVVSVFEEMHKAHGYLKDRSPSVKMILENISMIIPVK
ncbi:hypothetical protein IIB50_01495 [Patescibacteria group bacterium]|nr:hypothetical protein [Patescibacteria group bacterium]